jgi:uncharacterized membrane protein YuzA (DUF378 family)
MDPDTLYRQKKLYKVVVFLILVGGLNWLTVGLFGKDLVRAVIPLRYARWVYVLVGAAALSLLFCRDVYLPFLGETLVPSGALATKAPTNANEQVTVQVRPGAKVLYWAAEPNPTQGTDLPTWSQAYQEYENSGVVVADDTGKAVLRIRGPPQDYRVPWKGRIESHVHFRSDEGNGFLSRVKTVFLKNGVVEGFSDSI